MARSLLGRALSREAADQPPPGSGGVRSSYASGALVEGADAYAPVGDAPTRLATAVTVINFLSDELGALPVHVVETGDRTRRPVEDLRFSYLWGEPNSDSDAVPWWQQLWAHLEGWSNAFVFRRMVGDRTVGLDILHPSRVVVEKTESGARLYHYRPAGGGSRITYRRDQVVHIMRRSWDGIRGVPPITASSIAHRIAQRQDRWQFTHYQRNARPSGVVTTPSENDDLSVSEFYAAWDEQISAPGGTGVLLLQGKAEYSPILPATDVGLLQSLTYTREQILGAYAPGIPHHLLGWRSNTSNFGTGIEAQGLHLLLHVFEPRLSLVARTLTAHLLPRGLELAWDTREWLKNDAAGKVKVYRALREIGAASREEVRTAFNMARASVPDDFWQPKNMAVVGSRELRQESRGATLRKVS